MSTNYVKFGPVETVVQFATDRGELRSNDNGDFFFRGFADGSRFACLSPELERRILDLNYRAGEEIGITRQTRNRSVIWKVRLIEPATASEPAPAPRPVQKRTPPPLPESKYAPPPTQWPEFETPANGKTNGAPAKPPARAEQSHTQPVPQARDQAFDEVERCVLRATEIMCKAQNRAVELGCPTISLEVVQDLACTILIQEGKQNNIALMNRNQQQRANGGADPWRH
jgi:hypothetical protein